MIAFGLCKKGYFSGNPEIALNAPVDIVMGLVKYTDTVSKYEDILYEMNKDGN